MAMEVVIKIRGKNREDTECDLRWGASTPTLMSMPANDVAGGYVQYMQFRDEGSIQSRKDSWCGDERCVYRYAWDV